MIDLIVHALPISVGDAMCSDEDDQRLTSKSPVLILAAAAAAAHGVHMQYSSSKKSMGQMLPIACHFCTLLSWRGPIWAMQSAQSIFPLCRPLLSDPHDGSRTQVK